MANLMKMSLRGYLASYADRAAVISMLKTLSKELCCLGKWLLPKPERRSLRYLTWGRFSGCFYRHLVDTGIVLAISSHQTPLRRAGFHRLEENGFNLNFFQTLCATYQLDSISSIKIGEFGAGDRVANGDYRDLFTYIADAFPLLEELQIDDAHERR